MMMQDSSPVTPLLPPPTIDCNYENAGTSPSAGLVTILPETPVVEHHADTCPMTYEEMLSVLAAIEHAAQANAHLDEGIQPHTTSHPAHVHPQPHHQHLVPQPQHPAFPTTHQHQQPWRQPRSPQTATVVHHPGVRSRRGSTSAPAKASEITPFHSSAVPQMTLVRFAHALCYHTQYGRFGIAAAVALMARYVAAANVTLTPLVVHRLFLTAMQVGVKTNTDMFLKNSYFAQACGIHLDELNHLETTLLDAIEFRAIPTAREFWRLPQAILSVYRTAASTHPHSPLVSAAAASPQHLSPLAATLGSLFRRYAFGGAYASAPPSAMPTPSPWALHVSPQFPPTVDNQDLMSPCNTNGIPEAARGWPMARPAHDRFDVSDSVVDGAPLTRAGSAASLDHQAYAPASSAGGAHAAVPQHHQQQHHHDPYYAHHNHHNHQHPPHYQHAQQQPNHHQAYPQQQFPTSNGWPYAYAHPTSQPGRVSRGANSDASGRSPYGQWGGTATEHSAPTPSTEFLTLTNPPSRRPSGHALLRLQE